MSTQNLNQKLFGSALAGAFIFMCAYGAASSQFWVTVVGAIGIGFLLRATAKSTRKANTIPV